MFTVRSPSRTGVPLNWHQRGWKVCLRARLPPDAAIDAAWEDEWRDNIFQAALARVRQRVNPKSYQVFDYCVLQGVSAAEVRRMLGLNAAQVYLAKHRVSAAVKRAAADVEAELARQTV